MLTNEVQSTCLPSGIIEEIKPWLDRNVPSYKIVTISELPEDDPREWGCWFCGHYREHGIVFVEARLDPVELTKTVEDMVQNWPVGEDF